MACKGIGKILGCKYVTVYSVEETMIDAENVKVLIREVKQAMTFSSDTKEVLSKIPMHNTSKIPEYTYCVRCGNVLSNKSEIV